MNEGLVRLKQTLNDSPSACTIRWHSTAQDGLEDLSISFDSFDVLFLGGTTAWKLGPAAADLAARARARGLRVHCGRVNSLTRLRYAASIGCHSVDGTYLAYGPDRNLPVLLRWLAAIHTPDPTVPGAGCHAAARHPAATSPPPLAATAGQGNPVIDSTAPVHPPAPARPCWLPSSS